MPLIRITDYHHATGWKSDENARALECCRALEAGNILFFDRPPFEFPAADREWLLTQKQTDSRHHKNISYRPLQDVVRGYEAASPDDTRRMHEVMRRFSQSVTQMLTRVLTVYDRGWKMDYASFRPLQEQGRDLPMNRRNDLLHCDAFPTRPTHGGRILRVFVNLNPNEHRVWLTGEPFDKLAPRMAEAAGLRDLVAKAQSPVRKVKRALGGLTKLIGGKAANHSTHDLFMLHFHDWLKANEAYQKSEHERHEFPPNACWMVLTDGVPHAALAGQYALEQTYILPPNILVAPEKSPLRVLEALAGCTLTD